MKLTLHRMEARNFKCFSQINLKFAESGFTLVTGTNKENSSLGSNGLGKTSLFDAICWALYGKTASGASAGKLLNRTKSGGYSVTLDFTIPGHPTPRQEDSTLIHRSWKPNSLQINGTEVQQPEIEKLIGLTYEQFLYAVYFSQKNDHFLDMSAGQKLNFLSEVFELDKWSKCADVCKERMKTEKTAADVAKQKLQFLQSQINEKTALIDGLAARAKEWDEKEQAEINTLEAELKDLQTKVVELVDSSEIKQAVAQINDDLKRKDIEIAKAREIVSATERRLTQLSTQISSTYEQIEKLTNSVASKCPTCTQAISEEHVLGICEGIVSDVAPKEGEAEALNSELTSRNSELLSLIKEKEVIQKQKDEVVQMASEVEGERRVQQQIRSRIDSINSSLEVRSANPFNYQIEQTNKQLNEISDQIVSAELAVKAAETTAGEYEVLANEFPAVRLSIIDEVIVELEMHFNQALGSMGMSDWTVKVSTERELKNANLKRELNVQLFKNGEEIDLDTLSGGERQRVKVASAFGVSDLIKARLGVDWGLQMWDEPSVAMSIEGTQSLLDTLSTVSEMAPVMLADHRVLELGRFDNLLKIEKQKDGNSTVTLI